MASTAKPRSSDRVNLGPFDRIGYNILRRLYPGGNRHGRMDGSAYAGKSKARVLLGDALMDILVRSETVIDFGCGTGGDAIELARLGCRRVIGVDIQKPLLAQAAQAAAKSGVSDRVEFRESAPAEGVDSIVSLDAFEHFGDPEAILKIMHGALRPGGKVYASFGPTWYHPLGGHLFSVFPWSHVLFSEPALCAWRATLRDDGAMRFSEVSGGLNQMTIGRFERIVKESPLRLEHLECVPIRSAAALHNRLTREFTTAIVRAILVRPA
jgi:SAM-dependent methyltransferase